MLSGPESWRRRRAHEYCRHHCRPFANIFPAHAADTSHSWNWWRIQKSSIKKEKLRLRNQLHVPHGMSLWVFPGGLLRVNDAHIYKIRRDAIEKQTWREGGCLLLAATRPLRHGAPSARPRRPVSHRRYSFSSNTSIHSPGETPKATHPIVSAPATENFLYHHPTHTPATHTAIHEPPTRPLPYPSYSNNFQPSLEKPRTHTWHTSNQQLLVIRNSLQFF